MKLKQAHWRVAERINNERNILNSSRRVKIAAVIIVCVLALAYIFNIVAYALSYNSSQLHVLTNTIVNNDGGLRCVLGIQSTLWLIYTIVGFILSMFMIFYINLMLSATRANKKRHLRCRKVRGYYVAVLVLAIVSCVVIFGDLMLSYYYATNTTHIIHTDYGYLVNAAANAMNATLNMPITLVGGLIIFILPILNLIFAFVARRQSIKYVDDLRNPDRE